MCSAGWHLGTGGRLNVLSTGPDMRLSFPFGIGSGVSVQRKGGDATWPQQALMLHPDTVQSCAQLTS